MVLNDIRERLSRDPFEPFRIRSSSGEGYVIDKPHLVALMKTKVFIAFPDSDRWTELSYLHIAALESLTNGHAKRAAPTRAKVSQPDDMVKPAGGTHPNARTDGPPPHV